MLSGNDSVYNIENVGIIHANKIIYYENDVKVTIILEENMVTLLRETNEYRLTLLFEKEKETMGKYQMKNFPMELDTQVKTLLLEQTEHSLRLKYHLTLGTEEIGDFTFLLEYEVDV